MGWSLSLCHGFASEVASNEHCQPVLNIATLPNLTWAAPSTVTSAGPGLCSGWAGWLRASAAGHSTATQPPPASCQPLGLLVRPGAVLPRELHCHRHPGRWKEGCSPPSRGSTGSCGRLIPGDIFIRCKLKKTDHKKTTYVALCKFNAKGTIKRHGVDMY